MCSIELSVFLFFAHDPLFWSEYLCPQMIYQNIWHFIAFPHATYCYNMPLHYTLTRWQSYRCSVLFLSKQHITPSQLDNASVNIDQTKVRRERRKRLPLSEEEERSGGFRRGSKCWHIFPPWSKPKLSGIHRKKLKAEMICRKSTRLTLCFLWHVSWALFATCPPRPSGYEWPVEEIWRDFGFTSTSIYFTLLSIQHPKSIPAFLKSCRFMILSQKTFKGRRLNFCQCFENWKLATSVDSKGIENDINDGENASHV